MQAQHDSNSCGLFAIAVAVELVAKGDPTTCEWEVESMIKHLANCFQLKHLKQFLQIKKGVSVLGLESGRLLWRRFIASA